ncbi:homoserine dehydrogenase [Anaerobacillus sp. MEB173]|uniref:homoserine dehydrogenase n=1 Tax=Anaerobacillus sp. MEB173 TaxID=3383345 RepID=UPI003F8EB4D1
MTQKLALLGFGVVGQGLAEIILNKAESLRNETGFEAKVVAISDFIKGSIYHPEGLDIKTALKLVKETGKLDDYPESPGLIRGWDALTTIRESNADTILEATFTDVKTGQPAIDHCKAAFENGKNVVMSNKGPVALAYQELAQLAKENNVRWGFEGTVMSGTPALRMPLTCLAGNEVTEIRGILNGTTNYILTKMEEGLAYEDALAEAQSLGYAEADPTSDVEGYDARYKIVILSNTVMNAPLKVDDVDCKGITAITLEDIEKAKAEGKKWKLLARARKEGDRVIATIAPEMVEITDPLASITGATNAVTFDCDLAGPITLAGAGAGRIETGYSLLIDLINIHRGQI